MSAWELDVRRNELYARHGFIFKRKDLTQHFEGKSWYHGDTRDQTEVTLHMSSIERKNAQFILDYQNRNGLRSGSAPSSLGLPHGE